QMKRAWNAHGKLPEYSQYLSRIYRAISEQSGARLVVDSSKTPSEGLAAAMAPGVDVKFLHLVRDPRACAYSTSKRSKAHQGSTSGVRMKRKSAALSSARWSQVNVLTERYLTGSVPHGHYMTVRYEDLMTEPSERLTEIANWAGIDGDQ